MKQSPLLHRFLRTLSLTLVGAALIGAMWWWQYFVVTQDPTPTAIQNNPQAAQRLREDEQFLLTQLRALKQYGAWPLHDVPLSARRGDPFAPKP